MNAFKTFRIDVFFFTFYAKIIRYFPENIHETRWINRRPYKKRKQMPYNASKSLPSAPPKGVTFETPNLQETHTRTQEKSPEVAVESLRTRAEKVAQNTRPSQLRYALTETEKKTSDAARPKILQGPRLRVCVRSSPDSYTDSVQSRGTEGRG